MTHDVMTCESCGQVLPNPSTGSHGTVGLADRLPSAEAEARWRTHAAEEGPAYIDSYWRSWDDPHRHALVRTLTRLRLPITSILDLGCHCGPFLRLATRIMRLRAAWGVDISPEASAYGNARLPWGDFRIVTGSILRLEDLHLPHFDAVVSTYSLAYVAPEDLPGVLASAAHLASYAMVLVEPMVLEGWEEGEAPPNGEWRHDYVAAFKALGYEAHAERLDVPRYRLNGIISAVWRPHDRSGWG